MTKLLCTFLFLILTSNAFSAKLYWECIDDKCHFKRARITIGWLIRDNHHNLAPLPPTYVPDPDHRWTI